MEIQHEIGGQMDIVLDENDADRLRIEKKCSARNGDVPPELGSIATIQIRAGNSESKPTAVIRGSDLVIYLTGIVLPVDIANEKIIAHNNDRSLVKDNFGSDGISVSRQDGRSN